MAAMARTTLGAYALETIMARCTKNSKSKDKVTKACGTNEVNKNTKKAVAKKKANKSTKKGKKKAKRLSVK